MTATAPKGEMVVGEAKPKAAKLPTSPPIIPASASQKSGERLDWLASGCLPVVHILLQGEGAGDHDVAGAREAHAEDPQPVPRHGQGGGCPGGRGDGTDTTDATSRETATRIAGRGEDTYILHTMSSVWWCTHVVLFVYGCGKSHTYRGLNPRLIAEEVVFED